MRVRFNRSKGDEIYAKEGYFYVVCLFGLRPQL